MTTPARPDPVGSDRVGPGPVRPRNAASLILLRRGTAGIEVLLGRRGASARFMPGRYVFPGGGVQRSDARAWRGEAEGCGPLPQGALRTAARAALRETFEETGLIVGRPAVTGGSGAAAPRSVVEQAYHAAGLTPALDALVQIGRAITPTLSPIRFHARFFVADGALAHGPVQTGDELDAVGWYGIADGIPAPMSSVTQFMLRHAVAVWTGTAPKALPLYRHIKRATRIEWRALDDGAMR